MYKNILKFFTSLFVVFLFSSISNAQDSFVFIGVNIIDVNANEILHNKNVYIEGDRIINIQEGNDRILKGYAKIKAKNKFLMPGMMDAHAHLPGPQGPDMPMEDYLMLQLANGVTSLRSMRYETGYLDVKRQVKKGEIVSPNLYLTAPAFSRRIKINKEELLNAIPTYKEYDHIKYLSGLDKELHKEACKAAEKIGLKLVGHLPKFLDVKLAVEQGQKGIEHFNGYLNFSEKEKDELIGLIQLSAENNIFNCPTLDWYEITGLYIPDILKTLSKRKGLEYLPNDLLKKWNLTITSLLESRDLKIDQINPRVELLKLFIEHKAPLLISPSAGPYIVPGFGMYEEMKIYKNGGVSNWDIIKAATINGAKFYDQDDNGLIKMNYKANLVLLNNNPIDDLGNIRNNAGVMVNGKWYNEKFFKKELKKIAKKVKK